MEKPLLELRRFGHKIHLLIKKEATRRGIDFMAGPQGQVLHVIGMREEEGQDTFIKDIEQNLEISKSVASNLVKRMETNGLIYLEGNPKDKRAKYVRLTEQSKAQLAEVRDFFDEIDRQLLAGVSEEEANTVSRVLKHFTKNLEDIGEKHDSNV